MALHKDTQQILKDAGLPPLDIPNWIIHLEQFQKKCKMANRGKGEEPQTLVVSMYRIKHQSKEYIYYYRELVGKDFLGNTHKAFEQDIGVIEKPEVNYAMNTEGEVKGTHFEMVKEYDIPFSKQKALEILKQGRKPTVNFYVMEESGFKFKVDEDEFLNMDFDTVVKIGRGQYVTVQKQQIEKSGMSPSASPK